MEVIFDQHIGIFKDAVPKEWCDQFLSSLPPNIPTINSFNLGLPYKDRCLLVEPLDQKKYLKEIIINKVFPPYLNYYSICHNLLVQKDSFNIIDYKFQQFNLTEGSPTWYFGNDPNNLHFAQRTFTYILYLNDVEEGGETEFLYQSKKVKPIKGTLIFFPSYWTHTYRDNPPLSNQKSTITGWLTPTKSSK